MAKILLVDDSKFIVTALTSTLEQAGHDIVGKASDGNEGFDLFKRLSPDLVLLDITMPNRDGQDCLKDILSEQPSANVIMISAIKEQDIVDGCIATGAKNFIQKPLQLGNDAWLEDFYAKITSALA